MKKNFWLLLSLLVVVALVIAACGGAAEQPAEEAAAPAEGAPAEEAAAPAEEEVQMEGASIKVWFGPAADEAGSHGDLIAQFEEATGATVEVVTSPASATDNLAQILQFVGAQDSTIDVYQIDVIWPGILADHAADLYEYIPRAEVDAHFPAIVENNTVDGKLVGLPWYTDAGLLYYRTDLLEKYGYDAPPATWDELEEMAATIQDGERAEGNDSFWGFVWQGNNYEGLTCDALEWQYSHNGGRIIEPDGTISVNNPNALTAFERAAGWVDTISPPGVTAYQEEDSRGVWQSGNAAFMRNWPYAYSLGNSDDSPIAGQFDVTVLPTGAANNAATLGGWQLMLSDYSENKEVAAEFIRFIGGREGQKERAIRVSLLPTIGSLYRDTDVLTAAPFMEALFDVFNSAVARPSTVTGELYNEVSAAYFNAVHSILTGEETAADAVLDLEEQLMDITGFSTGAPPDAGVEASAGGTLTGMEGETPEYLTRDYEGTNLKVYYGPVGDEAGTYGDLHARFEEATGVTVEVVTAPASATDNLGQQLQFLGAQDGTIDVYQIDVIWPGILAPHAVNLYDYIPAEEVDAHFPAIVENNTVDGKLVGLPWFTDAGLLYYRTDLVEKYGYDGPPATWDELEEMAAVIQEGERGEGNDSFWGFVWQGNNYEGLTCDALEWQVSEGGGFIIESDGTITANNPAAAAAFERAAGWVDTISPPGVTAYQEEEARGVWQSGNAAFMRNWPYAYSLGNSEDSPIAGQFDAAVLPQGAGGRSAATLGGWQLMLSDYSENKDAAAMYIRFMSSREAQKERAIRVSLLPTVAGLYSDPDLLDAQPFFGPLYDVFTSAAARPSTVTGELYNEVSAAYFNAVHSILTGEASSEDALLDLEENLVDITGFEVGQP
jgi:trehalose/maltose transport system substrate-binding protein